MRNETILTSALFTKAQDDSDWQQITLPHTWNNIDGQDGGGTFDRGAYRYKISLPAPTAGKRQFIQFDAANHIATVCCNGKELGRHEGGFSTFRFELTDTLQASGNELLVTVDNRESHVYPQQADFTFFGGLYRDVTLVEVEPTHFDLMQRGSTGVFVTPNVSGAVRTDVFVTDAADGDSVTVRILDAAGNAVAEQTAPAQAHTVLETAVSQPQLWNGVQNPVCYTAEFSLQRAGQTLDQISAVFGFRSYSVDPEQGFFLNGTSCPLRGVSRHQDRIDKGWAISPADHEEDLALILEVGANTVRLAHYQHNRHFYDICDQAGLVLWAEIPFISICMEGEAARANTLSQMTELIAQNYNHPAICFWGISNEITIAGETDGLLENLQALNALAKEMDPSRLTTMAQVAILDMDSPHNQITDVLSYNHYFGWYAGDVSENGPWFDAFHAKYPNRPFGVSEYGCEAILKWHSATPENHDYTEEYQAYYHEEMLKAITARPYLWATHVWNMFDFAAAARDEGGCAGRNNKGLVTYDRKTKKDSFFVYKAFWSNVPFVHVCGRRFADRAPGERDICVYSNCPTVTLLVNGAEVATLTADKIFKFENVALSDGANTITARAEGCADDTITLNGVAQTNPAYKLPEDDDTNAGNWFDGIAGGGAMEFPEGFFSVRDKIGDLLDHAEAGAVMKDLLSKMGGASGQAGKNMQNMISFLRNMKLDDVLKMAGKKLPAGARQHVNEILTKIKK